MKPGNRYLMGMMFHNIFNSFLNIFVGIYYSSFPLTQVKSKMNQNSWITPRIITSWKYKREMWAG